MQRQAIELRRFETPDQRLDMKEWGSISILQMAGGSTETHTIFEIPPRQCGYVKCGGSN